VSASGPGTLEAVVRLTRIYTRRGDGGDTSLGDGTGVRKSDRRVVACGEVDELNSVIGVARAQGLGAGGEPMLAQVQNDLFDVGADLCVPGTSDEGRLRVTDGQVKALEAWCDRVNEDLTDLTSFVLPAGTGGATALHHARTVCRRAERAVVDLADHEPVSASTVAYLNRLSDLLFILARAENALAGGDVLWAPGGGSAGEPG